MELGETESTKWCIIKPADANSENVANWKAIQCPRTTFHWDLPLSEFVYVTEQVIGLWQAFTIPS